MSMQLKATLRVAFLKKYTKPVEPSNPSGLSAAYDEATNEIALSWQYGGEATDTAIQCNSMLLMAGLNKYYRRPLKQD